MNLTDKQVINNQHKIIIALKTQHALDEIEIADCHKEINRLNDIITHLNHVIEKMMER